MHKLVPILEQMVVGYFYNQPPSVSKQSKLTIALSCLVGLTFLIGLGYLIHASFTYLETLYRADIASLIVGIAALFVSLLAGLTSYLIKEQKKKAMEEKRDEVISLIKLAGEVTQEEIEASISDHPKTALLATAIAGFIFGRNCI